MTNKEHNKQQALGHFAGSWQDAVVVQGAII